eukprot:6052139-Prymnesium_polylepis.1
MTNRAVLFLGDSNCRALMTGAHTANEPSRPWQARAARAPSPTAPRTRFAVGSAHSCTASASHQVLFGPRSQLAAENYGVNGQCVAYGQHSLLEQLAAAPLRSRI